MRKLISVHSYNMHRMLPWENRILYAEYCKNRVKNAIYEKSNPKNEWKNRTSFWKIISMHSYTVHPW